MIDHIQKLVGSASLQSVWQLHCEKMAEFGFDRLIYGFTRFHTDDSLGASDDAMFLSNHDPVYFEKYIGGRMFLNAPMTRWARDNVGACSWGALWRNPQTLSDEERAVIAFNRRRGVNAGYSISFPRTMPRSFGMIALAARDGLDQDAVDDIWTRNGREIEAYCNVAHLKIIALPHVTDRPGLTLRQREVLQWVGEGKSNAEVAVVMGVTQATVEKHLRLARERLGVDTTAQAILKASFQNQIYVI